MPQTPDSEGPVGAAAARFRPSPETAAVRCRGGGGAGGGDVVGWRGHEARDVTGSPVGEHFPKSVRRAIGTGGGVVGSGGGGEARNIILHPDGGDGEVVGSTGCRRWRRRRGPAAAAGWLG